MEQGNTKQRAIFYAKVDGAGLGFGKKEKILELFQRTVLQIPDEIYPKILFYFFAAIK